MKHKRLIIGLTTLALLLSFGATAAYAHWGNSNSDKTRPNIEPQNFEAIQRAIENNDYQTWSELTADSPISQYINENNFAQFVEMHNLQEQARVIAEELGLPGGHGMGSMHHGFNRAEAQSAE